MELPQSHSYDSILITMDRLSKHTHFIATMSDITLGVTWLFRDGIWKLHGVHLTKILIELVVQSSKTYLL